MIIKQPALLSHLQKKLAAVYILFGQEPFLLNEAAKHIKSAWQTANNNEVEETILYVDSSADWALLDKEAYSYSLFSNSVLLDIRYEKKTLDATAKAFLTSYLQNINPCCLLLLRAPHLSLKQLQSFANHDGVHVVQVNSLNEPAMRQWIIEKLQNKLLKFEQQVPAIIYQYTQGNMLACAQALEKLALVVDTDSYLTTELVQEQLVDQCDYQLFELADACLLANSDKVIQLLRYACHSKEEPTLVLWLLTQEIRLLIQLYELTQYQSIPFTAACSQLKIWPQRSKLYQLASKKIPLTFLHQLHQFCKLTDERIKSGHQQIWPALEQIALSLCLTKQVGSFA